jgi:dinuclear metal center YbgI/SA1388 family protein
VQAKVKQVVAYMEELAPLSLALPGDHVGLQLGNPEALLSKVLIAMDPDEIALEEAFSKGAGMLVCHHPLFFNEVSSLDENSTLGALVAAAIRKRSSIYCAHTNYDIVPGGVTYQLAQKLGLPAEGAKVLEVTTNDQLLKLVVFIPVGHENSVLDAIASAGAGHLGQYSHCAFQTTGVGSFMPGEEAQPYIGSSGKLEKVEEIRLETILPESMRKAVIDALLKAHPYEEAAYDLYPLALPGMELGLGLLVELEKPITMNDLLKRIRESLNVKDLRWWSPGQKTFRSIALCGGSGGSLIGQAARSGADIFISGDFRYHDLKQAQSLNLALIDAGHDTSEQPGLLYIQKYLDERLKADDYETEVLMQTSGKQSWQ